MAAIETKNQGLFRVVIRRIRRTMVILISKLIKRNVSKGKAIKISILKILIVK